LTANPNIKVEIKRLYRGVDYSIELDVTEIESVDHMGPLMRQAEHFIDKILDAAASNRGKSKVES